MSQISFAELRTAYDIGKTVKPAVDDPAVNPLVAVITAFLEDKRLKHFLDEDFPEAVNDLGDTLTDAQRLKDATAKLGELEGIIGKLRIACTEKVNQIIADRHDAGIDQEGLFEIVPVEKRANRKVNADLIREKYQSRYDLLLENKIDELKDTYKPTLKEVEAVFGKKANEVIIPGGVEVIGYDIRLIAMPEQASAGDGAVGC